MISQAKHWRLHPKAPDSFFSSSPEHPILLQVLYNRGVRSAAEVAAFLSGSDAVQENPNRMQDMTLAVDRILKAIDTEEIICVYGDFDADGVTATALLVSALQMAGARVGPYIPDRVDEGYGLNCDAVQRIAGQAGLMITVDCGIRSVQEVTLANELGMDVIVTDHHSLGRELPPALAVINPQRPDCPYPFERLAGVGVAYRLAQAVLRAATQHGRRLDSDQVAQVEAELLDLVALGTVADVLPLLGENRSLVKRGLARLNETQRPGLLYLYELAGLQPGGIDATAISFRIGPRINAAGRLAHAKLAYELLRTRDVAKAYGLAAELDELNAKRQRLTAEAQATAESQVAAQIEAGQSLYVAASPDFLPGIVGLVAGRLADHYYRPVVVVEAGAEESRGSARSIAEFNITAALDELSDLLVRHGGHHMAAGFTVRSQQLPELQEALQEVARRHLAGHADLRPTLEIDAQVDWGRINWGLQEQLARLEPTGNSNEAALFYCPACRVRSAWTVGHERRHLKLVLDNGPGSPVWDAIAFRQGHWAGELGEGSRIDLVAHVEVDEWQGRRSLQLNVQDMRGTEESLEL